jgi:hypothetical protein
MTRFARSFLPDACVAVVVSLAFFLSSCSASDGAAQGAAVTGPLTGATSGAAVSGPTDGGPAGGGSSVADVPTVGQSIVKTARLSLEVGDDGFTEAADRATTIAGEQGGYVESASSQGSDVRSGQLTLRIPVDNFEQALSGVSQLGKIRLRSVSGKDVTSKFVDLDARIRNAKAQEEVLLGILHQATTVASTLQVQRTLSDVQLQIEELVGQERALRDRAAFGTIVLDLFETGRDRHVLAAAGISNPKLGEAWRRAKATFFGMLYGIIVSAAVLIPLAILALAGWIAWRRTRPRAIETAAHPEA